MRPTQWMPRGWVCLLLALVAAPELAAQQRPLAGFDPYVERAMRDWKVPGLAIAVVKDDSVVFAKGYGVRELGGSAAVDPRTLFAIGSASKTFTAAAVGALVEEEKVEWDAPATRYLPELQLFDPYATRELSVRDLLTHRSGLARGDLLWYGTELDRSEILRRVRYLEPSWSLRSTFGYQNLMYLAAGEVVREVTGQSWDDFVKARFFAPLGMNESSTSVGALQGRPNVATPHAELDGRVRTVAWRNIDNIAPAGSINSNVMEMAKWVRMHLNEGEYEGRRVLSEKAVKDLQVPQTILPMTGGWTGMAPAANFLVYGTGWFMNDHRGEKVIHHGGNIDGMSAMVGLVPEEELGIVILTNMNGSGITSPLMYRVIDAFIGAEPTDWSGRSIARRDSAMVRAAAQAAKRDSARVTGTRPSLALSEYAGTYEDDMYGEVTVALENGRLVMRRGPAFVGTLEHWHYDTFQVTWEDPMAGKGMVTFSLNARGKVASVEVEGVAEYERKPEPAQSATTQGGAR